MENPYYEFAHRRLPRFCKNHPLRLFPMSKSEKPEDTIKSLWEASCHYFETDEKTVLKGKDIKVSKLKVIDYPALLIEMPDPKELTDAIYIAIILLSKDQIIDIAPDKVAYRYLLSELTFSETETDTKPILCEWTKTKHRSFGGDLKPGLDSFLNAVEQSIA